MPSGVYKRIKPAWNLGLKATVEHRLKLSLSHLGKKSGNFGHRLSEESKNKIRIARLRQGNPQPLGYKHSDKTKLKISLSLTGRKLSDAARTKLRERFANGFHPMLGKFHSKETKIKMSEAGKLRIGKKNPNWKGGIYKNKYPTAFNKDLKYRIRERDNFICQLCGITEEEHQLKIRRALSVNHIDFDKNNCNENNLNTLCLSCNGKVNSNRCYWTEYFQQYQTCTP